MDVTIPSGTNCSWGKCARVRKQLLDKFYTATPPSGKTVAEMTAPANDDRALFYGDGFSASIKDETDATAGFACVKFRNVRSDGQSNQVVDYVNADLPFFRVAEAYLIYAEASTRLNGSNTDAKEKINELRSRANAAQKNLYTLDDICDEWAREFWFEGRRRMTQAEAGIEELKTKVDSLVIIPNERLKHATDQKITFANAFEIADDVLRQAVQSISDLIRDTGFINLDFADVTAIMKDAGLAHMGVGRAAGKNKAEEAARMAISSPLLETSINGAHGVLINVTGSMDIGLDEVEQAASLVQEAVHPDALTIFGATFDETLDVDDLMQEAAHPDANIIFGASFDPSLDDEIRVTVIATGFDKAPGALDFNKDKKPAEQSGESAAAGLAPLDFDKEKAEEEAKHEDEPDPFDDIFKIFNRER